MLVLILCLVFFDSDAPPLTSINSAGKVAFRAVTSISANIASDVFRGDSNMLLQLSSDGFIYGGLFFTCGPYTTFETHGVGINSGGQVAFVLASDQE